MIRTATLALLLAALPVPGAGQEVRLTPFAAQNGGLGGVPTMVGLNGTWLTGPLGLRIGGAVDAPYSPLAGTLGYERARSLGGWSGDLDMVLSGGSIGLRLAGLEPSAFIGVGVHGLRRVDGTTATIPVWSYGGGVALPLTPWLSLDGEGRLRRPFEERIDRLPAEVSGGWEFRAGFSVRIRRGADRARAESPGRTRSGPLGVDRHGPAPTDGDAQEYGGRYDAAGATLSGARMLRTADDYVGTPYRWGGDSPGGGFDCSGFVQYVYERRGVLLPRTSRDQARVGRAVSTASSAFREGDLLFFAGSDGVIDHVGIYAGDDRILHASASRGLVAYDRLDRLLGDGSAIRLVAARRVIGPGAE